MYHINLIHTRAFNKQQGERKKDKKVTLITTPMLPLSVAVLFSGTVIFFPILDSSIEIFTGFDILTKIIVHFAILRF